MPDCCLSTLFVPHRWMCTDITGYAAQWVQKGPMAYHRPGGRGGLQGPITLDSQAECRCPMADVVAGHTEMASGQVTGTKQYPTGRKRQVLLPTLLRSSFALFVAGVRKIVLLGVA